MNIYDIAQNCNVSTATVSRVLNGNPNVSEKTRSRVMEAALAMFQAFSPAAWVPAPHR